MPAAPSTNYGLPRYDGTDDADYPTQTNALTDAIDSKMAGISFGLEAARPAPAIRGRLYVCTDTAGVDVDTHDAWRTMVPAFHAFPTYFPPAPYDGQIVRVLLEDGFQHEFAYRAGSGQTNKWESIGGASLSRAIDADVVVLPGHDTDAGTGPALPIALPGVYEVSLSARVWTPPMVHVAASQQSAWGLSLRAPDSSPLTTSSTIFGQTNDSRIANGQAETFVTISNTFHVALLATGIYELVANAPTQTFAGAQNPVIGFRKLVAKPIRVSAP